MNDEGRKHVEQAVKAPEPDTAEPPVSEEAPKHPEVRGQLQFIHGYRLIETRDIKP